MTFTKLIILPAFCFFQITIQAQDTSAILRGAKTIPASAEEKISAANLLRFALADPSHGDTLFNTFSLSGGNLWDKIKDQPGMAALDPSHVIFKMPLYDAGGKETGMKEIVGRVFQRPEEFKLYWETLYRFFELEHATIVMNSNKEFFVSWLYFASIEEPMITLQTPQDRLLLQFAKGHLFFAELVSK